jgi:glycerate kinase
MKIVIAPDSFKDSLSAEGVAQAIALGLAEALPEAELIVCPMADGGEGTVEALLAVASGERREATVSGPLGDAVVACWGWLAQSRTAIIEMAEASGLQLVAQQRRNAGLSSTYGTGQLILQALDAGAEKIILTIGGSATNDGGTGMLCALGVAFHDASGQALPPGGLALEHLAHIDISAIDQRLADTWVEVAADVDNPLCGPHGASFTFGRQKGASDEQIRRLDNALAILADCSEAVLGCDVRDFPGAGAAGGMGFAARAFLGADFRPGVEVVAELVGLGEKVAGADLVITGEGRCDAQTLRGKTPMGVARIARQHGVPVVLIAGTLGEGYEALYEHGIGAAFAVTPGPMSLEQACAQAPELLRQRARDIARLWCL